MRRAKIFVILLASWLCVWNLLLTFASWNTDSAKALVLMMWGLCVVWVLCIGTFVYLGRERIRVFVQSIRTPWQVTFVIFATVLALLEEVVTVTLTNMAPIFGSTVTEAHITATTNYFDLVLFHSVVVFVPFFIAWAIVLTKYRFSPFSVFLLFGITGLLCEMLYGGPQQIFGFAQWIFVYGLMIYLPAYCVPQMREAKQVKLMTYIAAIPMTFLIAFPMLVPLVFFITNVLKHPNIHF